MITPADVRDPRFLRTRLGPGYDRRQVDAFVDRIGSSLDRLTRDNEAIRAVVTAGQHGGGSSRVLVLPLPPDMPTPADVRQAQFAVTQRQPGYDIEEVDRFLTLAETALDQLLTENTSLRNQLAGIPVTPPPVPPRIHANDGRAKQAGGPPIRALLIAGALFAAMALLCGFGAVQTHAQSEKSDFTQSSGVPTTATVTAANVTGPKNPQTILSVLLGDPVQGQFVSQVTEPGSHSYVVGEKIRVLVDPQDPSYAELPGHPSSPWITPIGLAVFCLLFALLAAFLLVKALRCPRRPGRRAAGAAHA